MKKIYQPILICFCLALAFAACAPQSNAQTFSATEPPLTVAAPLLVAVVATATEPPFTDLPSVTPLMLNTATPLPSETPTLPPPTLTPTAAGTQPLYTLTPASNIGAPAALEPGEAPLSAATGWTCDDFPCADDIPGFLQRIQVPPGFRVDYLGRFPGQVMQITYGSDGLLYATVLENGTRNGAVYVMDAEGTPRRYSGGLISPLGLAFQPGTDVLFVSARMSPDKGAGIWRIPPGGGQPELVIKDLPCCFRSIDNQANGMTFGQDGHLYLGVGSLTDTTANPPRSARAYTDIVPFEASILRIDPLTGEIITYADGIHNPYDVAADSVGQIYATDNGLLNGSFDRLLKVGEGDHFGWPYWRLVGCDECPYPPNYFQPAPDLIDFPAYTRPRGLVVYKGGQFPANMFDNLFVTLWNGVEGGQRVIRIDPRRMGEAGYAPEAFVTGLIRPIDVTVAPDGSLVVADYVYGQIWRVVYQAFMG